MAKFEPLLADWGEQVKTCRIPRYNELPGIELYMDQVVVILEEYLRAFTREAKDRRITPAMINNYVKLKILPPPLKKKYNRTHLCYLIIICMLKQVLAISEIRDLIAIKIENSDIQQVYDEFCLLQENAFVQVVEEAESAKELSVYDLTLRAAVSAHTHKSLAERLIDTSHAGHAAESRAKS